MTAPDAFEDRLLEQLRHVVAENPAPAATRRRRPAGGRVALAGAGVAGVAAAAAVVATSGDVTPKAYAVDSRPDGSVTVQIRSLRDAAGLEAKLRAVGVPAEVDYVEQAGGPGCVAPPGGPVAGVSRGAVRPGSGRAPEGPATVLGGAAGAGALQEHGKSRSGVDEARGPRFSTGGAKNPAGPLEARSTVRIDRGAATFTIDPGTLRPDQKVHITTSTGAVTSVAMAITKDGVDPPCLKAPRRTGP